MDSYEIGFTFIGQAKTKPIGNFYVGCSKSMEENAAVAGGLKIDQSECRDGAVYVIREHQQTPLHCLRVGFTIWIFGN